MTKSDDPDTLKEVIDRVRLHWAAVGIVEDPDVEDFYAWDGFGQLDTIYAYFERAKAAGF